MGGGVPSHWGGVLCRAQPPLWSARLGQTPLAGRLCLSPPCVQLDIDLLDIDDPMPQACHFSSRRPRDTSVAAVAATVSGWQTTLLPNGTHFLCIFHKFRNFIPLHYVPAQVSDPQNA